MPHRWQDALGSTKDRFAVAGALGYGGTELVSLLAAFGVFID